MQISNTMNKRFLVLIALAFGLAATSRADLWSFDYSGAGVTASGTITTGAGLTTFEGNAGYVITGVSGQRNGVTITGLIPATIDPAVGFSTSPDGRWWFDNVLLASGGFDLYGLLFTTEAGGEYNLYKDYSGQYIDGNFSEARGAYDLVAVKLNVPDGGATIALLGGALIGLAALRRRFVG